MGQEAIAFAAPRTEDMTRVVVLGAGAGITGAVQGVIVKMAPAVGTLEPIFTWGSLLGVPALGAAGALFTRGMLSDLALGVAAGGLGVLGFQLPELLAPITGRRVSALNPGPGVKLLGAGSPSNVGGRVPTGARVGLEF